MISPPIRSARLTGRDEQARPPSPASPPAKPANPVQPNQTDGEKESGRECVRESDRESNPIHASHPSMHHAIDRFAQQALRVLIILPIPLPSLPSFPSCHPPVCPRLLSRSVFSHHTYSPTYLLPIAISRPQWLSRALSPCRASLFGVCVRVCIGSVCASARRDTAPAPPRRLKPNLPKPMRPPTQPGSQLDAY